MPRNDFAASAIPLSHKPGISGALARFCQRSYAADYIALTCLVAGWILIQLSVTPFHRMFYLSNKAIQFPFAEVERVSVVWSIIYAGVIPFIILCVWASVFRPGTRKVQVTILGFLIALMLSTFLTDIVKNAVGRPRPDLIARCQPRKGTAEDALVAWTVCTQSNIHILQEGWRSFPSGHSSFSFSGLGYLSYFFSGQMHVFRPRTDLGRCLLALAPFLCALMIAISRLDDYRHDVYDVTSGSILGLVVAYFSYRRYYPALRSSGCDTPYAEADLESDGFAKLADDEEQQIQERRPFSRWVGEEAYPLGERTPSHHV